METSGYVPVNGLEMYYKIHGDGEPLVLLHGAFSAVGTSFGKVLPGLAKTRRVIGFRAAGSRPHRRHRPSVVNGSNGR